MAEWFLFLPQVRLDISAIVERAHVADASGFDGIAFIDHLEAPGTADQSICGAIADRPFGAVQRVPTACGAGQTGADDAPLSPKPQRQ